MTPREVEEFKNELRIQAMGRLESMLAELKALYQDPERNILKIIDLDPVFRMAWSTAPLTKDRAARAMSEYERMKAECKHDLGREDFGIELGEKTVFDDREFCHALYDKTRAFESIPPEDELYNPHGRLKVIIAATFDFAAVAKIIAQNATDHDLLMIQADHPLVEQIKSKFDRHWIARVGMEFGNHAISSRSDPSLQSTDWVIRGMVKKTAGAFIYDTALTNIAELLKALWLYDRIFLICYPEDIAAGIIVRKLREREIGYAIAAYETDTGAEKDLTKNRTDA